MGITVKMINKIKIMYAEGKTCAYIAKDLGIPESIVRSVALK